MATQAFSNNHLDRKAYIITGPTSGIGRATAFDVARHGTVVLVGRDREKLSELQKALQLKGGRAVSVVCDLSDIASVRHAAAEIVGLRLPIAGLLNNAGIRQQRPTKNAMGWDMTFATDHLGPFALTEALVPHLPDGANVVFVASAVEDPERKPAKAVGFRGGRYISAEASARGEWKPGGATQLGFDAYATSKQCTLATVMVLTRETPRLHFNAVEPGVNPTTSLARDSNAFVLFLSKYIIPLLVPLLMPFMKFLSTPKRAARVITKILTDESGQTGVYYDESGHPMLGSALVCDPKFQDRVVAETRALLATVRESMPVPDACGTETGTRFVVFPKRMDGMLPASPPTSLAPRAGLANTHRPTSFRTQFRPVNRLCWRWMSHRSDACVHECQLTTGVRTSHEVVLREEAPGSRVIPVTFSRLSSSGSSIEIGLALVFLRTGCSVRPFLADIT